MVDTNKIAHTGTAPLTNKSFIAIGIDLFMSHSSIIIHEEERGGAYHSFEFIKKVHLDVIDDDDHAYYLIMYNVLPNEIPTFLAYCENIKRKSWGMQNQFFYDGSIFSKKGILEGNSSVKGQMTCVGFCLAVLDGFSFPDNQIEHTDWDSSSHDSDYLTNYCEKEGLNESDVAQYHKRITPLELFTSVFLELPVRKEIIDSCINEVENHFQQEQIRRCKVSITK